MLSRLFLPRRHRRQSEADTHSLFSALWRRNRWQSLTLRGKWGISFRVSHGQEQQHAQKHEYETGHKNIWGLAGTVSSFLSFKDTHTHTQTMCHFPLNPICQQSGNIKPKQMKPFILLAAWLLIATRWTLTRTHTHAMHAHANVHHVQLRCFGGRHFASALLENLEENGPSVKIKSLNSLWQQNPPLWIYEFDR